MIESRNEVGQSPLHYSIELGHVEIAQILINEGSEVNTKDNDDWTPLISAAKLGNFQET